MVAHHNFVGRPSASADVSRDCALCRRGRCDHCLWLVVVPTYMHAGNRYTHVHLGALLHYQPRSTHSTPPRRRTVNAKQAQFRACLDTRCLDTRQSQSECKNMRRRPRTNPPPVCSIRFHSHGQTFQRQPDEDHSDFEEHKLPPQAKLLSARARGDTQTNLRVTSAGPTPTV